MIENVTPKEQYELLEMSRISGFVDRARGTGRPTKKDRRQMESLWDNLSFDVPDDVADRFASDFGFDDADLEDDGQD